MNFFKSQKVSISLCIFVFLFVLIYVANAEDISPRLSVSPHTFELDVFPGETITEMIKVANKSRAPLPIAAKVVNFGASDETGGVSFDRALQDISIASWKWFEIEKPNFILDAGETERVKFKISVPKNAEPGGHYSVMLFEPRLPSFYFKEKGPRVIPVIGVLFLLSVKTFALEPEASQKLEVVEFSVPEEERITKLEAIFSVIQRSYQRLSASIIPSVQAGQLAQIEVTKKPPSSFVLRIKNNDIYHIRPYGRVVIYNIFGKEVGEAKIPKATILPGKIRRFPVDFSLETPGYLRWLPWSIGKFLAERFFLGKYQARLELKAESPISGGILSFNLSPALSFFSFPWKFWLVVVLLFALFTLFVVKYRRRIRLAFRALIGR